MSPSYAKPTTPAETAATHRTSPTRPTARSRTSSAPTTCRATRAVLDTYAFQWLAELVRPDQSHYMPRPAAVVLPGSTEEVQAVVRLANKYGLKVKPHGTGWYHWSGPIKDEDATLQLDMRRMDAILEIDEQNMYAVVEPYVIAAQLQAEVLPLGLNLNIPGVGCSSSIVASACAYHGAGPTRYFMGGNAENVLGMEWVTPEGEIVRTGSLGSGDGWFCSEGPGPSVRAICRGTLGSRGGLGVYTKCAVKLAPHLGQTEWNVHGTAPAYRLPVHENMRVYTLAVPDWDAWAEIYYRIYDNEIGYIFHRQFNLAGADLAPAFWLMYNDPSKTLSDVPEPGRRTRRSRSSPRRCASASSSSSQGGRKDDIELQDRILDAILEEVGGWKVERFCEQDMAEFTNMYLQRLGHKHINFVWAGGYIGSWMQFGTPDWVKEYVPVAQAGLERDAAGGQARAVRRRRDDGLRLGHPARRRHRPRAVRQLRPGRLRVHGGRDQAHGGRGQGRRLHRLPARQGVHLPADRLDGRADLGRARARQAAAGLPLPASDQGRLRPERRGRPHVPDAAAGLRARRLIGVAGQLGEAGPAPSSGERGRPFRWAEAGARLAATPVRRVGAEVRSVDRKERGA